MACLVVLCGSLGTAYKDVCRMYCLLHLSEQDVEARTEGLQNKIVIWR